MNVREAPASRGKFGSLLLLGQLVLALSIVGKVEASVLQSNELSCNSSIYNGWYDSRYSGALVDDLNNLWLFSDAELTNGQALEVASSTCLVMMNKLRLDRAGRTGPVPDKIIYDVMCSEECTLSDKLREEAMSLADCTCIQLSTQATDPTYHTPGDWCSTNTGRILCKIFGQCGRWNCRLSDFMCPRYEYNKQKVAHRGKGDCSGSRTVGQSVANTCILAVATVVFQHIWSSTT